MLFWKEVWAEWTLIKVLCEIPLCLSIVVLSLNMCTTIFERDAIFTGWEPSATDYSNIDAELWQHLAAQLPWRGMRFEIENTRMCNQVAEPTCF